MSEKSETNTEGKDGVQRLLDRGAEMLGSGAHAVTSGVLALLVGGPEGSAVGGVVGKGVEIVLNRVGGEISTRQLAPREETRVGAAFAYAAAEIKRRLEEGDVLRNDDFFDEKQAERSGADEVLESVLLKAQREPEEKKVRYMGYLFASVAFNPDISVPMAHQLSKAGEQLSYRQLCILRLSDVKDEHGLRDRDYRDHDDIGKDLYQILYECADLYNKEYINFGGEANFHIGERIDYGATLHRLTRAIPARMTLQGIGADLHDLMELCLIPDTDIASIAAQLK